MRRKIPLIALLAALGLAGTAYAVTTVTNVYVLMGKPASKKSGTKAHPLPFGGTLGYTVTTKPPGQRPNVVQTVQFTFAGLRVNTNDFPTCSTSTLNAHGPSACPKGSLVGTGTLNAEVGAVTSQSPPQIACQVETKIYNGGGNSLSYYAYATTASGQCALPAPVAYAAKLTEKNGALVQTINVPYALRHPDNNSALDGATTKVALTLPVRTTTLKAKKVKGKTVKGKKVGFFESTACPANHKRHVSAKFTLENGKSQSATLNVACS